MRFEDWPLRLDAAIEAARGKKFEWSQHDCATWALGVAETLTGRVFVTWRGRYKTEIGAARHLRKLGCQTVEELACQALGEPLPTPLLAQRGDVLLGGDERALGVCVGAHGLFVTQDAGLTEIQLDQCHIGWRV